LASLTDLDRWVTHINEDLGLWLFKQVNERLKRTGLIPINQQRLEDGTIKEYPLGSPEFPKQRFAGLLRDPLCTPFVGYGILVQGLKNKRDLLKMEAPHPEKDASVPINAHELLQRAKRNISFRKLLEEAWNYMEKDGYKTVERNPNCSILLNELSREWEQSLYDRQLLARLSFLPQPVIEWGLKMVRDVLPEARRKRVPFRRRYLNPRTDLKNDPLVTDELKDLPLENQREIIASGFRVLPKKREKEIFSAMGIDKKAAILRQDIWRLILPPLVEYLSFLQGGPSGKVNPNRAYREASRILNARYLALGPHRPWGVKYSVTKS
jgi:hypothetical protein